jgi:hypothetical protein
MAHRHQKGELLAGFLEDLPRIMMMKQQMELSERRLDIADKNAMADSTYRADALAQAKETAKNTEFNNLLSQAKDHSQRAIVYKQAGKLELAAYETKEGQRIDDEKALAIEVYGLAPEESLVKLVEYFNMAKNPADPLFQTLVKYKDEQIGKIHIEAKEIEADATYGGAYKTVINAMSLATASGDTDAYEKHLAESKRLVGLFRGEEAGRYKLGTLQGLPEVDDKDEDGIASELLKGTIFDVTSEAERYKDIPGYGILPEEELEKLYQERLPADKPAEVDDIKKISESDLFSNVKLKTTKQRAQIIGKILGREVSEEESEKLILDIGSAALKESGKEFLSGVATSIAKMPRTPIRSGQYMVD